MIILISLIAKGLCMIRGSFRVTLCGIHPEVSSGTALLLGVASGKCGLGLAALLYEILDLGIGQACSLATAQTNKGQNGIVTRIAAYRCETATFRQAPYINA